MVVLWWEVKISESIFTWGVKPGDTIFAKKHEDALRLVDKIKKHHKIVPGLFSKNLRPIKRIEDNKLNKELDDLFFIDDFMKLSSHGKERSAIINMDKKRDLITKLPYIDDKKLIESCIPAFKIVED